MDIIKSIEHEQLKSKIPDLKVGNTVKVHVRIKEGNKERIQVFEGIIIKVQGSGVNKTFTVRKISYGVGVEKTFLIHSPLVEKVELVRVGKARRAKLFYLRNRIGKSAKTKEIVGARIENKEIVIKGDNSEETAIEEEKTNKIEETVVKEVKTEQPSEKQPVEEKKENITETVKTEVEVATKQSTEVKETVVEPKKEEKAEEPKKKAEPKKEIKQDVKVKVEPVKTDSIKKAEVPKEEVVETEVTSKEDTKKADK